MKTLSHPEDRAEILQRLSRLQPESLRIWGKMSAHQMVCHLADSFRGVMGDKPLAIVPGKLARGLTKWAALKLPMQWPHNLKTAPEMAQEIGGTRPVEFAKDLQDLQVLFHRFTAQPRDFSFRPHPFFLEMSESEWMRWGYLHMDHHLRQFSQ